jgi:hypothetical protein
VIHAPERVEVIEAIGTSLFDDGLVLSEGLTFRLKPEGDSSFLRQAVASNWSR